MSTSIALVTWAEVSSERRMCSAIPRRIAVIGSSSRPARPPAAPQLQAPGRRVLQGPARARAAAAARLGRRPAGLPELPAGAASCGGCCACGPPDSTKARMSFLVTRPPRPVPETWPTSTPCSEAIRATTGETNVFSPLAVPSAGAGAGAGSGSAARLGRRRLALGAGRRLGLGGGLLRSPARAAALSAAGRRLGALGRDHRELRPDLDRLALLDEDLLHDRPSRGSAPRCRPCRSRSRAATRRPRSSRPPA